MSITENLNWIRQELPPEVKLVAVSKFHPESAILEAYQAGQRVFGENRVQELEAKQKNLPHDIEWHLLGHLQRNKVKNVVPFVNTIQSVDSYKLLEEINKHAQKVGRVINCLLEIHIAEEDSKFGFSFESCRQMLNQQKWLALSNVKITGVMGIATNTDNEALIQQEFQSLKAFFEEIKEAHFSTDKSFCDVSMGMSHDYRLAIAQGATIVRVGTSIFGKREY